jgi:hypothetical protein
MKKYWIVSAILIFALLLSVWTPAFQDPASAASGGTIKISIKNKSNQNVTVQMWGPGNYNVLAKKNATTKPSVLPGKYTYLYTVCGARISGEYIAAKNSKPLTIPGCAQVRLVNATGATMWLKLSGPASYNFTLYPGKTNLSVLSGTYNYTATGCGGMSKSGKVVLKGKKNWVWWCYH